MRFTKPFDLSNKQIVTDGCMLTVSGILIDLFHPDSNDILIEDIAHGLAHNCRWNGHTQKFWSVAQHCCMMYDAAPKGKEKMYLLHDSEEAYWGDMIKPLKNILRKTHPEVFDLMHLMRKIIYDKFGVEYEYDGVHDSDFEMLKWELENTMMNNKVDFWTPEKAKIEWLNRFYYENETNG
jgi:hypothetical protein